jgi:hypothetical protein
VDPNNKSRSYWLKTLHQWHWISSALCLLAMLLFAATGLTLNNASSIEGHPVVLTRDAQLPADVKAALGSATDNAVAKKTSAPLPLALLGWADKELAVDLRGRDAEWSAAEIYVPLPRPGGDAWLRIDRGSGAVEYERTDRGWISYLNDLHKGRNTGRAWSWFIDVFAVACVVFSITGLLIMKMHAANRPTTWPVVGLGVVIPLLLALLFIH